MIEVDNILETMAAARRITTTVERQVRLGVSQDKIARLRAELVAEMDSARKLMAKIPCNGMDGPFPCSKWFGHSGECYFYNP